DANRSITSGLPAIVDIRRRYEEGPLTSSTGFSWFSLFGYRQYFCIPTAFHERTPFCVAHNTALVSCSHFDGIGVRQISRAPGYPKGYVTLRVYGGSPSCWVRPKKLEKIENLTPVNGYKLGNLDVCVTEMQAKVVARVKTYVGPEDNPPFGSEHIAEPPIHEMHVLSPRNLRGSISG
ncbi:hypothetical protein BDM02DRAFT_3127978, partial [Thelephora ganbajun]